MPDEQHSDAELLRLGVLLDEAFERETKAWAAVPDDHNHNDPERVIAAEVSEEVFAIVDLIVATPARAPDGLLVKLRAIEICYNGEKGVEDELSGDGPPYAAEKLLFSMLRDLAAQRRARSLISPPGGIVGFG